MYFALREFWPLVSTYT